MKQKYVNRLCPSCLETCKQAADVVVVSCQSYRPTPHASVQPVEAKG